MGFFEIWEAWVFLILNVAIGIAYFIIPFRLVIAQTDNASAVLASKNTQLLARFILACGAGHIITPSAMFAGMVWMENSLPLEICQLVRDRRPQWIAVLVWLQILISFGTAAVSWEAAARLKLKL